MAPLPILRLEEPTTAEAGRLAAVEQYDRLDDLPQPELDDLTRLAASLLTAPISMISIVDAERQRCRSAVGWTGGDIARRGSFCGHAILQSQVFVVADAALDDRFAQAPLELGGSQIRAYAGAPLLTPNGVAIGTLCVMDRVPRQWSRAQLDALRVLSRQVMSQLELRRQTRALLESQKRLQIVTENARVGLVIVDRDRRYTYANDAYATILDLPSSAIVGQRVPDVLASVYDDQIRPRLDRAFAGERVAYELRKATIGGDAHYAVRYEPTWVDGVVTLVVVVITDITDGKQIEATLRAAGQLSQSTIDALSAHLCVLDSGGTILATNAAWRRFAAANRPDGGGAEMGMNYLRVCDAATGPGAAEAAAVAAAIRAALRGEQAEFSLEYPCHSPTEERWFVGRVTRLPGDTSARVVVTHENITEQKRAASISRRLAAIVDSSEDAIIGKDVRGIITSWNRGAEKIFGYSASEMVSKPITLLIPADRRQEEEQILERIRSGRSVEHFETVRQTKDGRLIDVSLTASPIRDAGGAVIGVSKVARDITERKRAEAALRASRELLMNVVNSTPSYIFATDRQHRYVLVNEAYARFLGRSVEEIVGRSHGDFYPADVAARFEAANEAVMASGEGMQLDETVLGAVVMTVKFPLRDANGTVTGLCGVATDITSRTQAEEARRASEERFRQLAENIREVFWMTDVAKNEVVYVSPAYERIWGRTCASLDESPRDWIDAIHPDDRARVRQAAESKQARGDYDETYRIRRPDGTLRWIHDRAFPVRNPDGDVVRIVGTAEDVTERRQLEEQFRQSQKMEAIGQLAGGVAHDFNNILAAILGNAELVLLDLAADHPAREHLHEITRASARAKSLIQQILAFSRQQAQERRVIPLAPVIEESVVLLRASLPASVSLVTKLDADVPPVLADATQVHQVLFNLCTNAWAALEDQPGRIEIRLETATLDATAAARLAGLRPGRFARLVVRDTGTGMDAATLERIFDPFFTTKARGKGTGLGLSVVHGIVHDHDGAVAVTSEPGRGASFEVYFPAADGMVAEAPTAAPASAAHLGEGQRILYVDDEEPLVRLVTRMLERLGYRVAGFSSAAAAIEAFRQGPDQFDLVITDLNMPGMSGLNVADQLLSVRPDLTVVLSSGHVTEDLRQRARAAGIRDVLYKPNTIKELSEAIGHVIESTIAVSGGA